MAEQVKVRIEDCEAVEKHLAEMGAEFRGEIHTVDTYFKQPLSHVLKITEDDDGAHLLRMKRRGPGFEVQKYDIIDDVKKRKKELTAQWGLKCVLHRDRKFYDYEDCLIQINRIPELGDFLLIEMSEMDLISPISICKELRIKNPDFVTESFDILKDMLK